MKPREPRRAVFLDRDGTVNEERDYLFRIEDFAFIPGVRESIRRLNEAGWLVVVVTNQSGVARGYYGEDDVEQLHRHINRLLAADGARVDAFYFCPHHPREGVGAYHRDCDCRKGRPGMLLRAADEHGIDLPCSYMIGDKVADVEAGEAAGCMPLMVMTGYGTDESRLLASSRVQRFPSLTEAVDYILSAHGGGVQRS